RRRRRPALPPGARLATGAGAARQRLPRPAAPGRAARPRGVARVRPGRQPHGPARAAVPAGDPAPGAARQPAPARAGATAGGLSDRSPTPVPCRLCFATLAALARTVGPVLFTPRLAA